MVLILAHQHTPILSAGDCAQHLGHVTPCSLRFVALHCVALLAVDVI